jgi:hypothetical protein
VAHLVSLGQEHFLSNFVAVNVLYHPVGVEVSELNWEGFEGVAFRNVILYSLLEFLRGEAASTDSFELVVGECSGEQVAQLRIPLSAKTVVVASN